MESGEFSALCLEALEDWLSGSDYRRYHTPYYAGKPVKRVGFRLPERMKTKAQKKAGWRNLSVVMSNLVKEQITNG